MNLLDWSTQLEAYLFVGAIMFLLGLVTIMYRKNAIGVLLGIELILNAAGINFVAFSRFKTAAIDGHIFTLFIIIIAAAEAAVALAIILRLYRLRETVDVSEATLMRN